jgi:hypothetical protein
LALVAFLTAPVGAQPTIVHGVDVFQTSTSKPTSADFAANPIPADFFCKGSAPFKGKIELKGVPLTTAPAGVTTNGDTVVERLKDGVFSGKVATIPVQVRALQLTGSGMFNVACPGQGETEWRVDACLCPGKQPITKIQVKVDQACGCGHFDGDLDLNTCLRFTRVVKGKATGKVAGPIKQPVMLKISDTPWCPKPGKGEPQIRESFAVDTNCDGKPDLKLPGTTNFHPGWKCDNQNVDCLTQYASLTQCHQGPSPDHPHCINPMCPRKQ